MAIVNFLLNQPADERLGFSLFFFGLALVLLSVMLALRAIDDL
jgi:hypothetical protein